MKIKINFDMDAAALLIAVLAVLLTFWQGYETRLHNRKSVVPVLDFSQNSNLNRESSGYTLSISNDGLGPAKIYASKVFFDGQEELFVDQPGFQTAFQETLGAVDKYIRSLELQEGETRKLSTTERPIEVADIIPAGERQNILVFEGTIEANDFVGLVGLLEDKLDISVCYCSIYDDQCQKAHYGQQPSLTDESCTVIDNQ